MKQFLASIVAFCCSLLCAHAQDAKYPSYNPTEFEQQIARGDVYLLDVRRPDEFAEGHIKGAHNLNVQDGNFERQAVDKLPMVQIIAVYCKGGVRSRKAADILVQNGYQVINLDKGYTSWTEAGKPVVKD